MEGRVLSRDDFAEWAKDYVLYCHIVSLVQGEKYPKLLTRKRGHGVHSFMFVDAEGTVLSRHGGPFGLEFLQSAAERARELQAIRRRAVAGDEDAGVHFVVRRVELFHLTPDEARAELKTSGLSPANRKLAESLIGLIDRTTTVAKVRDALARLNLPLPRRKALEPRLIDAEIEEILRRRNPPATREHMRAAARDLQALERTGKRPSTLPLTWKFWTVLMELAEEERNADLFEKSLAGLESYRKAYAVMPSVVQYFERKEKALESIRNGPRR